MADTMDLNAEGLLRVTAEDEQANYQKTTENLHRGAFDEWPNEAGVSALSLTHLHIRNISLFSRVFPC